MSADILREAYDLITGDRQRDYDHPLDDYSKVVEIFEGMTGIRLTVEQAILFMVSVKMARIRTNLSKGQLHHDSVVDAAGYLGCLSMAHEEKNRRAER
jgi:hypothetical protein